MTETAIIIPSRLSAKRLPNKPLKTINNKEMVLHVHDIAIKANIGEVLVATPDEEIIKVVRGHGGKAVITKKEHETGTDRIFEVFEKELEKKPKYIINLQGDMPNLNFSAIRELSNHMKKNSCDIGTLASNLGDEKELRDINVVKVIVQNDIKKKEFSRALDFFRVSKEENNNLTYHHIGIYGFTNEALIRYVNLKRSKLEIERKLEQLRALENNMKIEVGYVNQCPLSVDTEEDLKEIEKLMKNNNE
tara:strand:- start:14 stop:757 length:744 start_codon:yes stop_codon:yes gene_type:complete